MKPNRSAISLLFEPPPQPLLLSLFSTVHLVYDTINLHALATATYVHGQQQPQHSA